MPQATPILGHFYCAAMLHGVCGLSRVTVYAVLNRVQAVAFTNLNFSLDSGSALVENLAILIGQPDCSTDSPLRRG
jgi:hypothetical protein